MSQSKTEKHSTPDSLTRASRNAGIELSESELEKVAGGDTNTTPINTTPVGKPKAKVADKAFTLMDGYIHG